MTRFVKPSRYVRHILQAYLDGKPLQWSKWGNEWNDFDTNVTPIFNFQEIRYRLKTGPRKSAR